MVCESDGTVVPTSSGIAHLVTPKQAPVARGIMGNIVWLTRVRVVAS